MSERGRRIVAIAMFLAVAGLAALGLWRTTREAPLVSASAAPPAVMGTRTLLTVVMPVREADVAGAALAAAEGELRRVEVLMSAHIEASELSRLNRLPVGGKQPTDPELLAILDFSRQVHEQSDGAFDVTVGPLIELWKTAAKAGAPPTEEQIRQARAASNWGALHVLPDAPAVVRGKPTVRVDLGGIAKGYGIDKAVEAMRNTPGVAGGLVDVGGDVRCFGRPAEGGKWLVGVRSPFGGDSLLAVLQLDEGAVCTSGNYERFTEIAGQRYSHILDPRTGRPVDFAPSVTVFAADATTADAWATALSVLGRAGAGRLPDGAEALIVEGGPDNHTIYATPGMRRLLAPPAPDVEHLPVAERP